MIASIKEYRQTSVAIIRKRTPPVVRADRNSVGLWVCTAGGQRFAFTDLDDALAFRDEWNDERPPEAPEAIVRMMTACILEGMPRSQPGCRLVPLELPGDMLDTLAKRCAAVGLDVSRLVAALIFAHLNNMTPKKSGAGPVAHLEQWERGRRKFRQWDPQPVAAGREGGAECITG